MQNKAENFELVSIGLNAKKFSINFLSDLEFLNDLFVVKNLKYCEQDLKKVRDIFIALEKVKENSQISR